MIMADEASQAYQLVREGGPFVVAFVVLVGAVVIFWRLAGKPTLEALLTISANFAQAANKLESTTRRQEEVAARLEVLVGQQQEGD